jgi:enoyl-CoA hydratase
MTEAQADVRVEPDAGVLVITIDRPAVRNAIDAAVARGIAAAVDRLDGDPALAVGVLTGAGGTFCSGFDLRAFLRGESAQIEGRGFGGLVERLPRKPLIAAVEGWALAGGCELALACDLVVAAENASFGLPEVKRGLVAAAGGLIRLPRRLPYHIAMEYGLTGRPLPATRAAELGLVNLLTATGEALAGAVGLAREIAANGPLAVQATLEIVRTSMDDAEKDAFARQREIVAPVFASADAREGALAFREKRPPVWTAS